jgi:FkbM family methyltransferase
MKFDFVDIGTSDFDIGRGGYITDKSYLLVEPIQYYLEKLDEYGVCGENVVKCNAAVTHYNGCVDVWYISERIQRLYNLPYWVRGCNRIGEKHPTVERLLNDNNISENVWSCDKVSCMTFDMLCSKYNIELIGNLKIDTEGHDHIVLEGVIEMLRNGLVIENIMCEYLPQFGNTGRINQLCETIKDLFPVQKIVGEDIYLSKQ